MLSGVGVVLGCVMSATRFTNTVLFVGDGVCRGGVGVIVGGCGLGGCCVKY